MGQARSARSGRLARSVPKLASVCGRVDVLARQSASAKYGSSRHATAHKGRHQAGSTAGARQQVGGICSRALASSSGVRKPTEGKSLSSLTFSNATPRSYLRRERAGVAECFAVGKPGCGAGRPKRVQHAQCTVCSRLASAHTASAHGAPARLPPARVTCLGSWQPACRALPSPLLGESDGALNAVQDHANPVPCRSVDARRDCP